MKTFDGVVLVVIAVALSIIAARSVLAPSPSLAAQAIQYNVVEGPAPGASVNTVQWELNRMGSGGWELAHMLGRVWIFTKKP